MMDTTQAYKACVQAKKGWEVSPAIVLLAVREAGALLAVEVEVTFALVGIVTDTDPGLWRFQAKIQRSDCDENTEELVGSG